MIIKQPIKLEILATGADVDVDPKVVIGFMRRQMANCVIHSPLLLFHNFKKSCV